MLDVWKSILLLGVIFAVGGYCVCLNRRLQMRFVERGRLLGTREQVDEIPLNFWNNFRLFESKKLDRLGRAYGRIWYRKFTVLVLFLFFWVTVGAALTIKAIGTLLG